MRRVFSVAGSNRDPDYVVEVPTGENMTVRQAMGWSKIDTLGKDDPLANTSSECSPRPSGRGGAHTWATQTFENGHLFHEFWLFGGEVSMILPTVATFLTFKNVALVLRLLFVIRDTWIQVKKAT